MFFGTAIKAERWADELDRLAEVYQGSLDALRVKTEEAEGGGPPDPGAG